jgi:hypothetical protein
MKKLIRISVTLSVLVIGLGASEAFAQGRGSQRGGGQQGMRGRSGAGQYGYGAQAGTVQWQMMQNRYRWMQPGFGNQAGAMQQQCLRDGSGAGRSGYGRQGGGMRQGQMRGRKGPGRAGAGQRANSTATGGPLSQQEIESILLMREEEKLARDVYLTLGQQWNVRVFANIARSESRHMAAIKGLIQRYGLQDPVVDDTPGVFTNPKLAQLYDNLVRAGSASAADAYRVGVKIEELDIADLQEGLTTVTHSDIQRVYQNLLRASQNHLRAFTSQL